LPDDQAGWGFSETDTITMDLRGALKNQYKAGLATVRQAIERCPDALWVDGEGQVAFWRVVYHVLFYTHFYLSPREADFRPWESHREDHQYLGRRPQAPHDEPTIGEPYTTAQLRSYCCQCEAMIDQAVDRLDLDAPEAGFWWYKMPKFEHQILNIRHLQHHAAILGFRLQQAGCRPLDWSATG
jgi:hypothetical protein